MPHGICDGNTPMTGRCGCAKASMEPSISLNHIDPAAAGQSRHTVALCAQDELIARAHLRLAVAARASPSRCCRFTSERFDPADRSSLATGKEISSLVERGSGDWHPRRATDTSDSAAARCRPTTRRLRIAITETMSDLPSAGPLCVGSGHRNGPAHHLSPPTWARRSAFATPLTVAAGAENSNGLLAILPKGTSLSTTRPTICGLSNTRSITEAPPSPRAPQSR